MAACDNLYGTKKEWIELRDYLFDNNPSALVYMKQKPLSELDEVRLCYIPDIQGWLIENCTLTWVQERLNENFDIQKMICGKAHHEEEK
jgi:hypothetical protein